MARDSYLAGEVETTPAPPSPPGSPPEDPFLVHLLRMTPEQQASSEALWEACDRYGDDHDRAYADLHAGRHPLQQRRPSAR